MPKDKLIDCYLKTAPIGQAGGVSEEKIAWINYNFSKFFPGIGDSYLDIGPGQGEVMILWKRLGYQNIESVDISKDVHNHILGLGFKCHLVENTIVFLNTNKKKFDLIMLNDVVEHIAKDDLADFMIAVHESLKIGGRIIIKVPNAQSPHFSLGRYGDLTHIQSFTELSLTQLLRIGGFDKFIFLAEKQIKNLNVKAIVSNYFIMPVYFWWIRIIRSATYHLSPKILTQAIIVIATKE